MYLKPRSCYVRKKPRIRIHSLSETTHKNLRKGRTAKASGKVSAKADRKIRAVVQWLCDSAETKQVYSANTKRHHKYKLNFITLTLPTTEHTISDAQFKNKLLRNFLAQLRYLNPQIQYIWKVEAQANGNIHAHVLTNQFVHWKDIRKRWNAICVKENLVQQYQTKHQAMSESDYIAAYGRDGKTSPAKLKERYAKGLATNWSDPNSTDVKAIEKINNVAAYVSKYMAKNETGKRPIKGRLWGCSYELSRSLRTMVEVDEAEHAMLMRELDKPEIQYKWCGSEPDVVGNCVHYGDFFYWKQQAWGTVLNGDLLYLYRQALFQLKSGSSNPCQLTTRNTPQTGKTKSDQTYYNGRGIGVKSVKLDSEQLAIEMN